MTQATHHTATAPAAGALSVFAADCTVKYNAPVNAEYGHLIVDAPDSILGCEPGQFVQILCPVNSSEQPYLRRPMSIYSYDREAGTLGIIYKIVGQGTKALTKLKVGDPINIMGPLGTGYEVKPEWNHILLWGRGVGLASLAPLAVEAAKAGKKVTTIYSARSKAVQLPIDQFEQPGATVITVTEEEGNSGLDNIRRMVEEQIKENGVDAIYTCGCDLALIELKDVCRIYNVPGEVALEQRMACGLGIGQCCSRPFAVEGDIVHKRVCKEGPVFKILETLV
ncbi:dihydroorotate dehydrogenase electron transfer subunit [Rhodobacteraceae bacterium RKSG542]|uniref:dihydroorotate dehydrogenase electron transfer subunit n=1 Tax=Pseudovibrio flavus TaxID=2529854 RepID=UPI0012BD6DA0|nr:dihydroorotate dehydrogenase electron transfer subunit [Pseudovibrio flavus]MTI17666.1 dihydroorotate dehydrogenase electron transfer subunit [Pseudovibrio flavus]